MMRQFLILLVSLLSMTVMGQDFLSTRVVNYKQGGKDLSWDASVEFPTDGDTRVVASVVGWIGEVLEVEGDFHRDWDRMLRTACDSFLTSGMQCQRSVSVERSYEDNDCVTFEAMVTDKGDETWRWADCASFSKRDGHRIQLDEIFDCDESDIQRLMWAYRGDLPLDADGPEDLIPVNAGFVDGWVVVIGPARHYTGAPFRLRYEEIVDFLYTNEGGYFSK